MKKQNVKWSFLAKSAFLSPLYLGVLMLGISIYGQQLHNDHPFFQSVFNSFMLISVFVIISSTIFAFTRLVMGEPNEHSPAWTKTCSTEE